MRTMSIETLNVHSCLQLPFKIKNELFNNIHSTNKDNWKQNIMVENRKFTLLCWMLYPIVVVTFKVFLSWSRRLKKTLRSSVNNELVVFSFWHCRHRYRCGETTQRLVPLFWLPCFSIVMLCPLAPMCLYCYAECPVNNYPWMLLKLCWVSCELFILIRFYCHAECPVNCYPYTFFLSRWVWCFYTYSECRGATSATYSFLAEIWMSATPFSTSRSSLPMTASSLLDEFSARPPSRSGFEFWESEIVAEKSWKKNPWSEALLRP